VDCITCRDAYDPNEDGRNARPLVEVVTADLEVCTDRDPLDLFSFVIEARRDVRITLTHRAGSGRLRLELYNLVGQRLARVDGTPGVAPAWGGSLGVGQYFVSVIPLEAAVRYDLEVRR
jgi:hypothetical protein